MRENCIPHKLGTDLDQSRCSYIFSAAVFIHLWLRPTYVPQQRRGGTNDLRTRASTVVSDLHTCSTLTQSTPITATVDTGHTVTVDTKGNTCVQCRLRPCR